MCVSPPASAASTPPAQCCTHTPHIHVRSSLLLREQDHPTPKHMLHGEAGLLTHAHACYCRCQRRSRLMAAVATPATAHIATPLQAVRLASPGRIFKPSRTVLHPHTSHPRALLFGIARPRPSNAEAHSGCQGRVADSLPCVFVPVPTPLSPRGGCGNACNCAFPRRCRMCVSPFAGAASTPPAQCCSRTPCSHMRSSPALSDQDCPTVKHVADGKAGLLAHIPCVFCRCQRLSRLMTAVATPAHCHAAAACASRPSPAQLRPVRTALQPRTLQPRVLLFWHRATKTTQRSSICWTARLDC